MLDSNGHKWNYVHAQFTNFLIHSNIGTVVLICGKKDGLYKYIHQEDNHCQKRMVLGKNMKSWNFFHPRFYVKSILVILEWQKTSHVAKGRVFVTLELLNLNSHKMWSEQNYSTFHFSVHGQCKKMYVRMIHARLHWRQMKSHSCSIHWHIDP